MDFAIDRSGREITATKETPRYLELFCPSCGAPVDFRGGMVYSPHFAHQKGYPGNVNCERYVSGSYDKTGLSVRGAIARQLSKGILANLYLRKTDDIFELECRLGVWKGKNSYDKLTIETSKGMKYFDCNSFDVRNRFLLIPRVPVVQFDLSSCQPSTRPIAVAIRDSLLSFSEQHNFFQARGKTYKFIKKDVTGNETIDISKEILCLSKDRLAIPFAYLTAKEIGRIPGEDSQWYVSSISLSNGYTWDSMKYCQIDDIKKFFGLNVVYDEDILRFLDPIPLYEDEFGVYHLHRKEAFRIDKIWKKDFYINGKSPKIEYDSQGWCCEYDGDSSTFIFSSENEEIQVFDVSDVSPQITSNLSVKFDEDQVNTLIEEKLSVRELQILHLNQRLLEHLKELNERNFPCNLDLETGKLTVYAPECTAYLELDAFGRILWEVPEVEIPVLDDSMELKRAKAVVALPGFSKAKLQEIMNDEKTGQLNVFMYKDFWRN